MGRVEALHRNKPRDPRTLSLNEGTYNATFFPENGFPARFYVPSEGNKSVAFDIDPEAIIDSNVRKELFNRPSVRILLSSKEIVIRIELESNPEE